MSCCTDRSCRALAVAATTALVAVVAAGCGAGDAGGGAGGDGRVTVLATPAPLLDLVQRVGGGRVDAAAVGGLGGDAHAVELTPPQVAGLTDADLVVHVGGLSSSVDAAVALRDGAPVVDALAVDDGAVGSEDPHVWLDPLLMADVAADVADALATVDPDGAEAYAVAAEEVRGEMAVLEEEASAALAPCRGAALVVSHEAFGYLAGRHGLEQVGITGVDPHVEPTPARLRAVTEVVRAAGARTIFFDEVASPGVATALAEDLGVGVAALDPLEVAVEPDYATAMRANLAALRDGLVCDAA